MTNEPIDTQEEFGAYTEEELQNATDELAKVTPEDYLAMVAYMRTLEEANTLPEAGSIIFTELKNPRSGAAYNITVRDMSPIGALRKLGEAVKYAKAKYGLVVVPKHSQERAATQVTPATAVPAGATPSVVKPPSVAPAIQAQPAVAPVQNTVSTGDDSGTGKLNNIVVEFNQVSKKRAVKFSVGAFKYPFTDSRSSDVVANLFDSNLGFEPAHFDAIGAIYDQGNWGGGDLFADWQKSGKYFNVLRIHQ